MTDDAYDRIAYALERLADVAEKVYNQFYPPERERIEAIIDRPEDEKREQFSDKASEEWFEKTEAATPQGKSRFAERFEVPQTGDGESHAAEAGRTRKTGRKPRTTRGVSKHHGTDGGTK